MNTEQQFVDLIKEGKVADAMQLIKTALTEMAGVSIVQTKFDVAEACGMKKSMKEEDDDMDDDDEESDEDVNERKHNVDTDFFSWLNKNAKKNDDAKKLIKAYASSKGMPNIDDSLNKKLEGIVKDWKGLLGV